MDGTRDLNPKELEAMEPVTPEESPNDSSLSRIQFAKLSGAAPRRSAGGWRIHDPTRWRRMVSLDKTQQRAEEAWKILLGLKGPDVVMQRVRFEQTYPDWGELFRHMLIAG
jgi:hypothetical protein